MELGFKVNFIEDIEGYSSKLKPLGFDFMEVSAPYEDDPAYTMAIIKTARKYCLGVSVHGNYGEEANIASYSTLLRNIGLDRIKKDIEFAAVVGAGIVTIHPGQMGGCFQLKEGHPLYDDQAVTENAMKDDAIKALAASLRIIDDFAGQRGIKIGIENMCLPCHPIRLIEDIEYLFSLYEFKNVGITLDTGHALVMGIEPSVFVRTFGKHIIHTHVHWNDGHYDLHLPPCPCMMGIRMDMEQFSRFIECLNLYLHGCPVMFEMLPRSIDEYKICWENIQNIL